MYAWIERILDYYVLLSSDLRDPAGKGGGLRFADFIGPWKAASCVGWGHGHHSTQICAGLHSGAHCFDHDLATVDSDPGRGDCCPIRQFLGFRLVLYM